MRINNLLLALSIVGNAFFLLRQPQVTVYTNEDIYYLKGNKLSSEHLGLIHQGKDAAAILEQRTAEDCSPMSVFRTLDYYLAHGYLSIVQYSDGYTELQYDGANWGQNPNENIKVFLEGFEVVCKDSLMTVYSFK